jgi:general secretion pathway protein E
MLREIADAERRTLTIENATSYRVQGVTQLEIPSDEEYLGVLGKIAEQAPDVVLASDLQRPEFWTAIGPETVTSTLLLGEMRAEDGLAALSQLRENGVSDSLLASSLRLIIAQRLVPRLDPHAREVDTPSAHVVDRLSALVPDAGSAQFYRAVTSEEGHKLFRGLELIYEVIEPTDEIRNLLQDGATAAQLREAIEGAGVTSLRECAVSKAARALIELEEAL